jgi:hypothetical protein
MEASSTHKNSVEMVLVIHDFLFVYYFMFLTRGFNDFPTMNGTNNRQNNIKSHTFSLPNSETTQTG